MRRSGIGAGFIIFLLIVGGAVGGYLYYNSNLKETVEIEKKSTSVTKYVDLTFSFGEAGKLLSKSIDLRTNEYIFEISLMNTFDKEVNATICPFISLQMANGYDEIKSNCLQFKIKPGTTDGSKVSIPITEGDKKKICNATKISLNITIENDGVLKSLAELVIDQGYPTHESSKTPALQINPQIQPNPILLDRDKEFSLTISVGKYAEKLTIDKITVNPVETKIITKKGGYERVETIGIDKTVSLDQKHEVLLPDEKIDLGMFPAPSIKVEEKGEVKTLPLDCNNENVKALKVCELQQDEKVSESFKKIYIEIDVLFNSLRRQTEHLYIDKTQCPS